MCHNRLLEILCSDKTLEELQHAFKSRTGQIRHQSVSLAACDVIAASKGKSLSLLLRHIRELLWQAAGWAGCGRRGLWMVVKAIQMKRRAEASPDKQTNKIA